MLHIACSQLADFGVNISLPIVSQKIFITLFGPIPFEVVSESEIAGARRAAYHPRANSESRLRDKFRSGGKVSFYSSRELLGLMAITCTILLTGESSASPFGSYPRGKNHTQKKRVRGGKWGLHLCASVCYSMSSYE